VPLAKAAPLKPIKKRLKTKIAAPAVDYTRQACRPSTGWKYRLGPPGLSFHVRKAGIMVQTPLKQSDKALPT